MLAIAVFLLAANVIFSACFYAAMKKRFSRERMLSDVARELDLLYKDLQREIDGSLSVVEDRMEALKGLIEAADKRILLAASEIEKREKAASFVAKPSGESRLDSPPVAAGKAEAQGARGGKREMPRAAYTKRQIVEKAAEAASPKGGGGLPGAGLAKPEIPVRERVVMLARQDISPDEISKILSIPQSEVDLILALDL